MRRRRHRRAVGARRAFHFGARAAAWTAHLAVAGVGLALGLAAAAPSAADCIVVRERTPRPAPHVAIHFGDGAGVPRAIQCAAALPPGEDTFCVPLWAYNLQDGFTEIELGVRLPREPLAFEADPALASSSMTITPVAQGVLTGLHLMAFAPLCGPRRLGCLRLATADLPDDFVIVIEAHPSTQRCAARDARGLWQALVVDAGGARVGEGAACPRGPCIGETPVSALEARAGTVAGTLDLNWRSGSGTHTLLCARTDGRFPNDPWDGQILALLPADLERYSHAFSNSGMVHLAAWSVTRGPYGSLFATSTVECGALVSARVDLPVGISNRSWGHVKTLFR